MSPLLGTTKILAACAALSATALVSVGLNLDTLLSEDAEPGVEIPRGPPTLVGRVKVEVPPEAPATAADLVLSLEGLLARLAAAEKASDLDEGLVADARGIADTAALLDAPQDVSALVAAKGRIHACLAVLLAFDGGDGGAPRATLVGADLRATLRAVVALLAAEGVPTGSALDAETVRALVADVETRLAYAKGNVWTLRAVKAQATALATLVADLEATGALATDVAADLTGRLGAALRLCLRLLVEIDLGGDGCDGGCREKDACDDACPPPPPDPCVTDCGDEEEEEVPEDPCLIASCEDPCADCDDPCLDDCGEDPCDACEDPCTTNCTPPPPPPCDACTPCGCKGLIDLAIDVDVDVIVDGLVPRLAASPRAAARPPPLTGAPTGWLAI